MHEMKIKLLSILGLLTFGLAFFSCHDETEIKENELEFRDTLTVMQHVLENGRLVAVTNFEVINYNTEKGNDIGL